MKPVKAIFFDVDGTLVSFRTHRVPASAAKALAGLRAAGVRIFIATGRMLPMLSVLDGIPFDGYITCNGVYCTDGAGVRIYAAPVPQTDLEALAAYLEGDPFPVAFMSETEITINCVNDRVLEASALVGIQPPAVRAVRDTIGRPVYQICMYADDDKVRRLMDGRMRHCSYSRWTPYFVDVNVAGNSKRTGIDRMLAHCGIRLEETMAFGDGGNDITMLQHVATGIAMGNAEDRVKDAAAWVTSSVDDDGISRALAHFGLPAF
ncbi:MAG: Cof-type HAD-IIB family hydrolase [Tannerella sp.]|jgi:Cof subfamily protein (haloacid dehalogenase superfamily)|nr:Cof-type HAD-IIB family hydrolase [Tannerella sp.]